MFFNDFFEFAKFVGLLSGDEIVSLNLPSEPTTGAFQPVQLPKLLDFVYRDPSYHIVTETSDNDDFEHGGCKMDNEIRYVNRSAYFLANGSDVAAHLLEEYDPDEWMSDSENVDEVGSDTTSPHQK